MFLSWILKTVSKFRKRKGKLLSHVFTSSINREIRHFHVVVVQRREGNVQKSMMRGPSCCFTNQNLLLFPVAIIRTLTSSRAGELSRSWIPKNNVQIHKERKIRRGLFTSSIKWKSGISLSWSCDDGNKMYKWVCCSFDVLVAAVVDRILRSLFPTTTATTDTRYPLLVSLPVPVPIPLPATRYPLPAIHPPCCY